MSEHRLCVERLPWYVNGTLTGAEVREVEAHLADCEECREELGRCRALASLYESVEDLAPAPHPARIARLWTRVEAEEGEPPTRFPWRLLALAEAAALVVLLALGVAMPRDVDPTEASPAAFRTLGDTPTPTEARTQATRLRVVFAPETPEESIRRILQPIQAEIVGGPSALGVYTVAVPRQGEMQDWAALVLGTLRREDAVLLAEAVREPAAEEP